MIDLETFTFSIKETLTKAKETLTKAVLGDLGQISHMTVY